MRRGAHILFIFSQQLGILGAAAVEVLNSVWLFDILCAPFGCRLQSRQLHDIGATVTRRRAPDD